MGRALVLLTCCTCAFALNPDLDVSQYAHASWKIREGFTKGQIRAIAQTADGYLWLGTDFGVLRFDGVRNVAWQPPQGQTLPSSSINRLLVARDGTLWIGTLSGLASWGNGKLTQYAELAGLPIMGIVEDQEGSVWAGSQERPTGKLCAIRNGGVRCYEDLGGLGARVFSLHEDAKGNLWVGMLTGVWRWKPGPSEFYPVPGELNGIRGMEDSQDGALLMATTGGVKGVVDGKVQIAYPFPPALRKSQSGRLLRDRDGGLWIATTTGGGVVHIHHGRTDIFSQSDGLSGDGVYAIFEDREGTIWVSTVNGLDRFRELPVVTYSVNQGLSNRAAGAVLTAADGSILTTTVDGLNRLHSGQVTAYRERGTLSKAGTHEILGSGVPEGGLASLYQDSRGRIWVSTATKTGYLDGDRFISSPVPGGNIQSVNEDTEGNLWMANLDLGLYRLSPNNEVQQIPWATLGHKRAARSMAADPSGGLWLGFYQGGVEYFRDGQVRASYAAADGLGKGRMNHLRFDRDGALWASTEGGLSRIKDGRIATLTSQNGLPCDGVHWSMEDDANSVWLNTPCGLVRIARSDLDAWARGAGKTSYSIHATVFDSRDGLGIFPIAPGFGPRVTKSPDGKLWFAMPDGVGVVDPAHLPFNKLPPPVHVEGVKINGKETPAGEGIELSSKTDDLEIDYTALSMVDPDRMRFRYTLEGFDKEWHDAGTRRQAFYTGLAPKQYRFRVMASNNDGVWNEAGAVWSFSIAPAYYQTLWFQGLSVAAFAGLIWLLYRLRLRQATARVNLLYEERLAERTRIARDLHDTLLQSLAGVSLQLNGISKQAAPVSEKIASLIGRVQEQVDSAFREARVKVWNLRSPELQVFGLEASIRQLTERIGAGTTAGCDLTVSGQPRPVEPDIEEELLRIAQEAANNASRHAEPNEISIALDYGARSLMLSISDDGRGFDFEEGMRKSGHWGLKNMQERAAQIGGTCKIATAVGQGTRIEIRVPLAPAWSLRKTRAKHAHTSPGS